MKRRAQTGKTWRRIALLLLTCALLLKLPAGWMPEASARGVSIGWCNAVSPEAQAEGQALLEQALADRPTEHAPSSDQPCSFAAAAQPIVPAAPLPELAPVAGPAPVFVAALAAFPGLGLAAPPPLSTGPPRLA